MIEYSLKALTADELSFKVNPVKATPDTKFEIKPLFSRQIRHVTENPKINIVVLECKIESTEESPKPFNLLARFVGVFEVQNMETDQPDGGRARQPAHAPRRFGRDHLPRRPRREQVHAQFRPQGHQLSAERAFN